jgi:anaerobic selenocysteine-containing dehydrogenase
MIGQAERVCGVWAMGVTQHQGGSDTSTAIANLLLVGGHFGRPGTGGYPMRGHNNVQGADDFGAMNNIFPGYEKVRGAARAAGRQGAAAPAASQLPPLQPHSGRGRTGRCQVAARRLQGSAADGP